MTSDIILRAEQLDTKTKDYWTRRENGRRKQSITAKFPHNMNFSSFLNNEVTLYSKGEPKVYNIIQ